MWYTNRIFKYLIIILMILLIIFMFGKIGFFLTPLQKMFSSIFAPILIAGVLYYILRNLVVLLIKLKIPKTLAILITFILLIAFITIFSFYTGSIIVTQFNQFVSDLHIDFDATREFINNTFNNKWFQGFADSDLKNRITEQVQNFTIKISNFVWGLFGTITNISTTILLVPFVLFFFLKDDSTFIKNAVDLLPRKHRENFRVMFADVDKALSSYISGQMLVALGIGIMMFIGYMIIGLKYPFILALFTMITCIVPFFGPILGIIPALIIGINYGPFMIFKIFIVMNVAQQIDNNFISPNIVGKTMHVHPLTVIFMLMIGSGLFGLVGLIIAIPVYAAVKVTVKNIHKMYYLKQKSK